MLRRAVLLPLGLAAALACGCEDARPSAPGAAGSTQPEPPAVAAPASTQPEPAPDAAPGPAAAPPVVAAGARLESEPVEETPVPALEDLLRLPASSEPRSSDPLAFPPPPPDASPAERAAWRERIRLERRSSEIGPSGPRQGTYSETDASLRVPVSDRVQLEGGVRVNQRDEPGREAQEGDRGSASRVGVEVQF